MQDSARGSAAARERESVEGSNVSATRRSRRRWSAEEKARVVRESLRPGKRVGEVARRYGISRWQLSTWRSLARQGKLAVAPSAEAVGVEPRPQPAFAALEVDSAAGAGPMGSVVIEAREVNRKSIAPYLRIAGPVTGPGARLATGPGGLTLGRAGFAPAG